MPFQIPDLRKKLIFLGTPDISARVLDYIYKKANRTLQIIAVVTQPPARSKRGGDIDLSPVHQCALNLGIPVLTPVSAKDNEFLETIEDLKPDLCLTAAYGNFLPKRFLSIPKFGTLNIHPSLLPLYRGASPVQRALENGDAETGVTLLFSTLTMDAGPIFLQEKQTIDPNIKSSALLEKLFARGGELFVRNFQHIFTGNFKTQAQDETCATYAKKLSKEEGMLDFHQPAMICHNKVRAFNLWPKTMGKFQIGTEIKDIKILTTEVIDNTLIGRNTNECRHLKEKDVCINESANTIDICCGDLNILRVSELQEPGKRMMTAKEFINGLRGRRIICL